MRRKLLVGVLLALCCGCSTMNNTDKGLLGGAGLGALAGGLIGSTTGHTGAGTAIGAGLGAVAGGLTGSAIDNAERRAEENAVARASATQVVPAGRVLSLQDVAGMAQQGISDSIIINQIRNSTSAFVLTPTDIYWLKTQGVSDAVVTTMQNHYPRAAVVQPAPVVVRQSAPVYIIERPPPPPVGIGFMYRSRGW